MSTKGTPLSSQIITLERLNSEQSDIIYKLLAQIDEAKELLGKVGMPYGQWALMDEIEEWLEKNE